MNGNKPALIAWDSCVFLAWFKDEQDKPLAAIEVLLTMVKNGNVGLLVSAVCGAEVLNVPGTDAGTQFSLFLKRDNVITANVDMRIAERAARIREGLGREIAMGGLEKGLRAPDALIVATALTYKADAMHTFDPDLLALNGSPLVDGLRICLPEDPTGQQPLFK